MTLEQIRNEADLEPFIGPSGRVSEVLNRKRPLRLRMVKRLHDGLKIPYESLLAERRAGQQANTSTAFASTSRGMPALSGSRKGPPGRDLGRPQVRSNIVTKSKL